MMPFKDEEVYRGNLHLAATVGRLLHPLEASQPDLSAWRHRDTFREACLTDELRKALHVSVGDWLAIYRRTPTGDDIDEEPFIARLVEPGLSAEICPLPSDSAGASPSSSSNINNTDGTGAFGVYLPTNFLELLRATPGRSVVTVAKRANSRFVPPCAKRAELSRVRVPDMRGQWKLALKSFFSVPRILREGELISVPVGGLPRELFECEADPTSSSSRWSPSPASGDADFEATNLDEEGCSELTFDGVAPRPCTGNFFDPVGGFAFHGVIMFRVERLVLDTKNSQNDKDAKKKAKAMCCAVDSTSTEVTLQGYSQARGIPYMANHLFCRSPLPLPAPLEEPFKKILSTLAPMVRLWAQGKQLPNVPHTLLLAGPRGCGKRLIFAAACDRLGLHLIEVNCYHLTSGSPNAAEEVLEAAIASAIKGSPAVLVLRRLKALATTGPAASPSAQLLLQRRLEQALGGTLRRLHTNNQRSKSQNSKPNDGFERPFLALAGTCEEVEDLGGPLRKAFQIELSVARPDQAARKDVAARLLSSLSRPIRSTAAAPHKLILPGDDEESEDGGPLAEAVSKLTAGLSYSDLRSVCCDLACQGKLKSVTNGEVDQEAMEVLEKAVKRLQGGSKVAVTLASKVQWADVGGLDGAKEEIMNCITLPLSQGQMFEGQKVRSGVLLFGPPGTGKTLLAKAVATECKVHFLSVKGPELLSMYIGESERNVRDLFMKARELAPCVVFFDELDSLAPARGRGSDSGGVMDRIVSQLITELDTVPSTVFLVGATNRPDLLDRSLLRPGRLDRMVYLGIAPEKLPLLKAITRKFHLEDMATGTSSSSTCKTLLEEVAEHCPKNLTGADVSVLCADAYGRAQRAHLAALHDIADKLEVSIQTLLLFLESSERDVSKTAEKPSTGAGALRQLFPLQSQGKAPPKSLDDLPLGTLCLLSAASSSTSNEESLLAIHRLEGSHGTCSGVRAVAFDATCRGEATAVSAVEDAYKSFLGRTAAGSNLQHVERLSPLTALNVQVGLRHFQEALASLQPSVSMQDLAKYEALREEYSNTKK